MSNLPTTCLAFADQIIPTMTDADKEGLEYLDADGLREEVAFWVQSTLRSEFGTDVGTDVDNLGDEIPGSKTWSEDDVQAIMKVSLAV